MKRIAEHLSGSFLQLSFGANGLALRGHRDSGTLLMPQLNSQEIDYTQGNFRATLQFMASCNDKVICEHISNVGKNCTYISPRIQNDILKAIGTFFQKRIVQEVKEARFFSLLADETTDVSVKEQLTMCLRFVRDDSICEPFLLFEEHEFVWSWIGGTAFSNTDG